MNYLELQMGGDIIKPIKYHIGEWEALVEFSRYWRRWDNILDVGCGIGYGVGMMNLLGFKNAFGIDLNPDKITVGKHLGYDVVCDDIMNFAAVNYFDVIWCSHAFEHMKDASKALERLLLLGTISCTYYFILPYPDLNPAPAHTASKEIGLDIDDGGETVERWFNSNSLKITNMITANLREPEIWIEAVK